MRAPDALTIDETIAQFDPHCSEKVGPRVTVTFDDPVLHYAITCTTAKARELALRIQLAAMEAENMGRKRNKK